MRTGYLGRAAGVRVEHVPCPHPGVPIDQSAPAKGILHTTEGSSIEGALSVFRRSSASTFLLGRDLRNKVRVLQLVPLGMLAPTLRNAAGGVDTNRLVRAQIEIVGFSKKTPWLPDAEVTDALARLMLGLRDSAGIPLLHTGNPHRDPARWLRARGWLGHADVPENDHWDPGRLRWLALFNRIRELDQPRPKPVTKPRPRRTDPVRTYRLVRRANGLVYTEPCHCPKEAP